jgi:RND family efflux transporter MFP subunit
VRQVFRSPFAILVAIVLVAGGGFAWHAIHRPADAAAPAATAAGPTVALTRAVEGSVEEAIVTQGRVGPPAGSDAKLAFPLSGTLAAVQVRVGDAVVKGQALAEIDRRGLAAALAQARADASAAAATYAGGTTADAAIAGARAKLAVAEAHLAELRRGGQAALSDRIAAVSAARQAALKVEADRRTLERETALFSGGVAAQKDVDAARSQLAADLADQRSADAKVAAAGVGFEAALRQAEADVAQSRSDLAAAVAQRGTSGAQADSARARVDAAARDYANGVLRAPSDGVVVAILKHPGESVDPTTPVVDVAPPLGRDVTLVVPSVDAQRVHIGDNATLRLSSIGERTTGRVVAVVPAVDPTTQATTVVVDGLPKDAVAGQAVSARIVVGRAAGIVIPSTAVATDPQTGKTVVFVRNAAPKGGSDNPFASREVTLGATDGTSVVIRSGLRPGESVAAQGAYDLLAPAGGG